MVIKVYKIGWLNAWKNIKVEVIKELINKKRKRSL